MPDDPTEEVLEDLLSVEELTAEPTSDPGSYESVIRNIDVPRTRPGTFKDLAAHNVAKNIVSVFRLFVLGALGGGFLTILLILILSLCCGWSFDKQGKIITKALIPLLSTVGSVTTTIFGPLLAFVLGYYFGEKKGQ